uniref:Uncharacterized protein n=1 Tax=Rhizophora mucronata TaxID=61149 RepID=A0A2P2QJT3_RHIMU
MNVLVRLFIGMSSLQTFFFRIALNHSYQILGWQYGGQQLVLF